MDVDTGDVPESKEGSSGSKEKGAVGKEKEKEAGGKDGKEGKDGHTPAQAHPPAKRYRLTEAMKSMIWELVVLSNECCRLENEKKSVFEYIFSPSFFDCFFFRLAALKGQLFKYQIRDYGRCFIRRCGFHHYSYLP